jgi:hypothetical protein
MLQSLESHPQRQLKKVARLRGRRGRRRRSEKTLDSEIYQILEIF